MVKFKEKSSLQTVGIYWTVHMQFALFQPDIYNETIIDIR